MYGPSCPQLRQQRCNPLTGTCNATLAEMKLDFLTHSACSRSKQPDTTKRQRTNRPTSQPTSEYNYTIRQTGRETADKQTSKQANKQANNQVDRETDHQASMWVRCNSGTSLESFDCQTPLSTATSENACRHNAAPHCCLSIASNPVYN